MPYSSYKNLKKAQRKAQKKAFSLIELSVVVLIIGILIAGITSGSRLVRDSRLKSAAQLTKSSDVNNIPDLVLWLEPTLENSFAVADSSVNDNNTFISAPANSVYNQLSVTTNPSYVADTFRPDNRQVIARWNDINPRVTPGNRKSVYQHKHSNRPMYIANAINGLPALNFSGPEFLYNENRDETPSAPPLVAGDKSMTYVAVFVSNNIDNINRYGTIMDQFVGFPNDYVSGANISMGVEKATNNSEQLAFATWIPDIGSLGAIQNQSGHIALITLEDKNILSSNNLAHCVNQISKSCGRKDFNTNSMNVSNKSFSLAIRSFNNSPAYTDQNRRFVGYIGEVMVFDRALKNEEIDSVTNYLSKKWGITLK
ncbi:MAG: prepilin-type N-terminal cleavage/methylation domain-containing protein [Chlamydiae bacterium]|nr:prepilin-type N-terminal cleavage/methylation domain-containing protein [Chlamydiota bacterium]